jgi:diadenylate cyclase
MLRIAMADFAELSKRMIEVAIFAALIYFGLRFLRRTRGSNVLRGLAYLGVAGVASFLFLIQFMGLDRLKQLFEMIVQSVVIALIVVFHPEMRRAIVHIGESKVFARLFRKETKIIQRVSRAVESMSKVKMGALIAIERDASLQSIADSGTHLDAELSPLLLESLFYPKSTLHDGAVILRDNRVVAAACLLPLSQNPEVDKRLGTRHRAALGLSEETDALAVVVSEETGTISTALAGKLSYAITKETLEKQLEDVLNTQKRRERAAQRRPIVTTLGQMVTADPWRKLSAVGLAILLWLAMDQRITASHTVAMKLDVIGIGQQLPQLAGIDELFVNIPTDTVTHTGFVDLSTGEPIDAVKLTFEGPKTSIENLYGDSLKLSVKLPQVEWDKVDRAGFTATDIQPSHRALVDGKIAIVMDPPRVSIQVVRVKVTTLQLGADQIELMFNGDERLRARLRDDTFEFTPKTVELFGPARAHEELAARKGERPMRAQLAAPSSARQIPAQITLQPQFEELGLRLRERCSLTVQLRPEMQGYSFDLPVLVDDLALPPELRNQYRPDTPTKAVRIKAGGALLSKLVGFEPGPRAEWARANLRLLVWIPPREDESSYPEKILARARLYLVDSVRDGDNAADFGLEELVTVELIRTP